MARGFWGVDVSRYSIKAVRLEGDKEGNVRMTDLDVTTIPAPAEGDDGDAALGAAILDLKTRKKIGGAPVCISLPGHNTFNRIIKLPPVEGDQIAEIVKYEAQGQIPFPLEEVVWDFQVVERDYLKGEEQEVMLFAVKREIVENFLTIIEPAALNIELIQFAPVAMFNYLAHESQFKGLVALDFGADNTDLMLSDGARFWIRNVPVTGNQITKVLAEKLNKPFAEAERIKRKAAQSKQAQALYSAMSPVYQELASEIQRSFGFFKSVSRNVQFEKVVLMGNASKALNFQRFMQQALRMPAERVSKFATVQVAESVDQTALSANIGSLGTAVGLGLQGLGRTRNRVNLLPVRFLRLKQIKRKEPVVIASAAVLLLTAFLAYSAAGARDQELKNRLADLKSRKGDYTKIVGDYTTAREMQASIDALANAERIYAPRDFFPRILDAVGANIPGNGSDIAADRKIWVMNWQLREQVEKKDMTTDQPPDAPPSSKARTMLPAGPVRKYELELKVIITERGTDKGVTDLYSNLLNWNAKDKKKVDAARPSAMSIPGLKIPMGEAVIIFADKAQTWLSEVEPPAELTNDPKADYGIKPADTVVDPDRKDTLYRRYTIRIAYEQGSAEAPPPPG